MKRPLTAWAWAMGAMLPTWILAWANGIHGWLFMGFLTCASFAYIIGGYQMVHARLVPPRTRGQRP